MKSTPTQAGAEFIKRLHHSGFFHHYTLLGDANLRLFDWDKMSSKLTGDLAKVWRFLLLGGSLSHKESQRILGREGLAFLADHKLVRNAGGELSLGDLSLMCAGGFPVFIDRRTATRAYVGQDTRALMTLLPSLETGCCLSLSTFSGAEVLPLASRTKVMANLYQVAGQEGIVRANLALNLPAGNWQMVSRERDCLAGQHDVILGSIPSFFEVPGVKLPPSLTAGPDGLRRIKEALALGSKCLSPSGEMLFTFLFFGDLDSQAMETKLRATLDKTKLNYSLIISGKLLMEPGLPLFNQMLALATQTNRTNPQKLVDKLLDCINRKKFGAVYLVRGRFSKTTGAARRQIIDYSDIYYGAWTF